MLMFVFSVQRIPDRISEKKNAEKTKSEGSHFKVRERSP